VISVLPHDNADREVLNMASPHRTEAVGYDAMRGLEWSRQEKSVARKAFDLALKRELESVMLEAKKRAEKINQPSELWELERYLAQRRTDIGRQFDYRYSVLILVFANLIRQKRLSEKELKGLSEDKLASIRRYAEL